MSFLPVLHQTAPAVSAAGGLYAVCIALAAVISILAPSSALRKEARKTLKIPADAASIDHPPARSRVIAAGRRISVLFQTPGQVAVPQGRAENLMTNFTRAVRVELGQCG